MREKSKGMITKNGNSTMFRERKNVAVPYNLDPSYFRNTILYFGKTIDTGVKALISPTMHRKKKMPVKVLKFTPPT